MPKNYSAEAEKQISKAELYYNDGQYKKAAKFFNTAGDFLFKDDDFKTANDCYYNAAKSFLKVQRFYHAVGALRNAGDCSLFIEDYLYANKLFKNAIKYILELKRIEDRDFSYLLFSSLSYLCLFLEGKQDIGLDFLKQIKKKVDSLAFKESPAISLVKNLTVAIRDKNLKYLDKVEANIENYEYSEVEVNLVKKVLALAKAHVSLEIKTSIDKDQYTTKDLINLNVNINSNSLVDISQNPFYNCNFNKLTINNIGIEVSENITIQKKPEFPISLKIGEEYEFKFIAKTHFQVEEPFIGPISLNCEFNDKFAFLRQEKEVIKPNIISPPPSLNITLKNLRPPLIGQSFPLEILIENKSQGDAFEVAFEVEFPKELKVIRGTIKKQIYSLSSNDTMKWEISLKPTEPGDFNIKMDLKFKDPDQNEIEEIKNFPFSIKL